MFGLGAGEILVILVIALIFIGPKKLPDLAKNLGKTFREFQNAMKGINTTIHSPLDQTSQEPKQHQVTDSEEPSVSRSSNSNQESPLEKAKEEESIPASTHSDKKTE